MSRTLKDSKKDARNFRASFIFVSYLDKQDTFAPNVTCLESLKPFYLSNKCFTL